MACLKRRLLRFQSNSTAASESDGSAQKLEIDLSHDLVILIRFLPKVSAKQSQMQGIFELHLETCIDRTSCDFQFDDF